MSEVKIGDQRLPGDMAVLPSFKNKVKMNPFTIAAVGGGWNEDKTRQGKINNFEELAVYFADDDKVPVHFKIYAFLSSMRYHAHIGQ
jgi:hypothetical protein